jgi:hypothetical protein
MATPLVSLTPSLRSWLLRLWQANAPLTAAGLLMLLALPLSLAGMALDPRTIGGAPAWLKPAKFAASTGIYSLTLAWMFTYLTAWPRVRRVVGWTTAVVLVLEVGIIDLQAWRGVASHFNVGTPFDAALFAVMGVGIFSQTLASIAVAVALWRQPFADAARGWALRAGMALTIVGAFMGGMMTQPTAAQLDAARATGRIAASGQHTVGAPDGGPGLPGTGWSLEHGDLRVPHFVGLHALQLLPLVALAAGRLRRSARARTRLVLVAAGSYAGLFALLLVQALRGQPLLAPDAVTSMASLAWLTLTGAALVLAARGEARTGPAHQVSWS